MNRRRASFFRGQEHKGWQLPPMRLGGRQSVSRRAFLKASAAGLAAAGAGLGRGLLQGDAVLASEDAETKRKTKDVSSKSLAAARCPVTGDSVSKEFSVDYRRGRLYFCSAECMAKFKADWSRYEVKANVQLVVTGQFKQVRCPLTGDEFVPAIKLKVGGVDVYFSSADAVKKLRRASADKRTEWVFGKGFENGFAAKDARIVDRTGPTDKWVCVVCGYVHKGSAPPATCPKCGAKSDSFTASS